MTGSAPAIKARQRRPLLAVVGPNRRTVGRFWRGEHERQLGGGLSVLAEEDAPRYPMHEGSILSNIRAGANRVFGRFRPIYRILLTYGLAHKSRVLGRRHATYCAIPGGIARLKAG
jgi:hypothetical protein